MAKVKVLQLNTWHGGILFDQLISFLKEQDADILHLQEVYSNPQGFHFPEYPNYSLFQYIQEHFDYPYFSFSKLFDVTLSNRNVLPMGNATFSRYPILESEPVYIPEHHGFDYRYYVDQLHKDFSNSPAHLLQSEIEIEGKKMTSINMHGVWGFDGFDNSRRLAMSQLVLDAIQEKEFVICTGDFNTDPETKTMRQLREQLHDPFYGEVKNTFNNKRWKHTDKQFVVDYLMVSKDIEVVEKSAPEADISDHMPLVATVEL